MNNKDIFSCIALKLDFNTLRNFYLANQNSYKAVNTLWEKLSYKYPQLQDEEAKEIKEEQTKEKEQQTKEKKQKHYYIKMGNLENLTKRMKNTLEYLWCLGKYEANSLSIVSLREFGYLNLKYLTINKTEMREIPYSITQLGLLEELNLWCNKIEDFSILFENTSKLSNLESLLLYDNHITHIPNSLNNFKYKNKKLLLNLSRNRITEIENIWELEYCRILLKQNHIEKVVLDHVINCFKDMSSLIFYTKKKTEFCIDFPIEKEIKVKDNLLYLSSPYKSAVTFKSIFSEFIKLFLILCIFARSSM